MADAVRTEVIVDSSSEYVIQLFNESDGTGETLVKKIDVAALAAEELLLKSIWFMCQGMGVKLYLGATANQFLLAIPAGETSFQAYPSNGYLRGDKGAAGWTGDLFLSTITAAAGASYMIVATFQKA